MPKCWSAQRQALCRQRKSKSALLTFQWNKEHSRCHHQWPCKGPKCSPDGNCFPHKKFYPLLSLAWQTEKHVFLFSYDVLAEINLRRVVSFFHLDGRPPRGKSSAHQTALQGSLPQEKIQIAASEMAFSGQKYRYRLNNKLETEEQK